MNGPLTIGRIVHFPTPGMTKCYVGIISEVGESGIFATVFEPRETPRPIGPIKAGWHWPKECGRPDPEVSWYGPKEQ